MVRPGWRIASLLHDFSSNSINRHFKKIVKDLEEPYVTIGLEMDKHDVSKEVIQKVKYSDKKALTVYGSGSYHHITYGLCKLANNISNNYTYIHIDHHNDYGSLERKLDCGSFVSSILNDKLAKDVIMIGCSHSEMSNFTDEWLIGKCGKPAIEDIILKSKCNNVYLSIDLDVMLDDEISTSPLYSRGRMTKGMLLEIIGTIKSMRTIISADILGYSFSLFPSKRKKAMLLYEDIAKAILGEEEWQVCSKQ